MPARSYTFTPPEPLPEVVWAEPKDWRRVPHGSDKRKATYKIPAAPDDPEDAELAVFYFGKGQGGSTEANIDRWKAQFPDADAADVKRTERKVHGMKQTIVDVSGTFDSSAMAITETTPKPNFRLIGAVVETPAGNYFFKLLGPAKTVESARKRYLALLDSVNLEGAKAG